MVARCRRQVGPLDPARQAAAGFLTKRTAEDWLAGTLDRARRGTLPGMVRTGATFADAAEEWLRYVEQERGRKALMLADYRSVVSAHLLPAFGELSLERVDDRDDRTLAFRTAGGSQALAAQPAEDGRAAERYLPAARRVWNRRRTRLPTSSASRCPSGWTSTSTRPRSCTRSCEPPMASRTQLVPHRRLDRLAHGRAAGAALARR